MKKYNEVKYTPLVADSGIIGTTSFRFESPSHFVSFIEQLEEKGIRGSDQRHSNDNDEKFRGSRDLNHAFQIFRESGFQPEDLKTSSVLVNKMRHRPGYHDDGDEIAVQEYLANDKYFIQYGNQLSKYKYTTFNFPLTIHGGYNCGTDKNKAYEAIRNITNVLYTNRIRFPKIVYSLSSTDTFDSKEMECYVEVPYTDFNALSKMIQPSTFRGLGFRLSETNPRLNGGYGRNYDPSSSIAEGLTLVEFIGLSKEGVRDKIIDLINQYHKKPVVFANEDLKPRILTGDPKPYPGMKVEVMNAFDNKWRPAALSFEDNRWYICQDEVNGNSCSNKNGFRYSYVLEPGKADKLSDIKNLQNFASQWQNIRLRSS